MNIKFLVGENYDGILIPLKSGGISFERKFFNLNDLTTRESNSTSGFNFSLTDVEEKFGSVLNGNLPYKLVDAILVVDGMPYDKGHLILMGIDLNKREARFMFRSGLHEFWREIEGKSLKELSGLANLNHGLSVTEFENVMHNDWTGGITYAFSEFGRFKDDDERVFIDYQMPMFFVRWIWNKIFEDAGFDVDRMPSEFEVITPDRGWDNEVDAVQDVFDVTAGNSYDVTTCETKNGKYYKRIYLAPDNVPYIENGVFKATNDGVLNYDFEFSGDVDSKVRLYRVLVYKRDNNGDYTLLDEIFPSNVTDICGGFERRLKRHTFNLFTRTYSLAKDEEIWVYGEFNGCDLDIWGSEVSFTDPDTGQTDYCGGSVGLFRWKTSSNNVAQVNAVELMPDIKQTDFIKDILIRNGWWMDVDSVNKKVRIVNITDVLSDEAVELNGVKIKKVEFMPKKVAKENWFRYLYRPTEIEGYADYGMGVNDEKLVEKVDIYKTFYRASLIGETKMRYRRMEGGLPKYFYTNVNYTPFWIPERDESGNITKWKKIGGKSYYLRVENWSGSVATRTVGGVLGGVSLFKVARFNGLGWRELLMNGYKEIFERIYNDYMYIVAEVRISFLDWIDMKAKIVTIMGMEGKYLIAKARWSAGKMELHLFRI